jgi:hypothetical protein
MNDGPPSLIAVNHDDYHAKHVGRTSDGRQFFLTTPFVPAMNGSEGAEFIALYLFDKAGKLLEAQIDELGPRAKVDMQARRQLYDQRLKSLGEVTYQRIQVEPFALTRFGVQFGFIIRTPEEEDEPWVVEVLPGNVMAFHSPWDSGDYDT